MRVGAITESSPPPAPPTPSPNWDRGSRLPYTIPGRTVMPLSDCDAVVPALRRGRSGCCSACLRPAGGPAPAMKGPFLQSARLGPYR